jgi:hypothetical protein
MVTAWGDDPMMDWTDVEMVALFVTACSSSCCCCCCCSEVMLVDYCCYRPELDSSGVISSVCRLPMVPTTYSDRL